MLHNKSKAEAGSSPNPKHAKGLGSGGGGGGGGSGLGAAIPPLPGDPNAAPPWASAMEARMTETIAGMFKAEVQSIRSTADTALNTANELNQKLADMKRDMEAMKEQISNSKDSTSTSKVQEMVQEFIKKEGEQSSSANKSKWGWWSGGASLRAHSGGARSRNYDDDPTLMSRTAVVSGFEEYTHTGTVIATIKQLFGDIKGLEKPPFTYGRRANAGYLQFKSDEEKRTFLRTLKGPVEHGSLTIYVNREKSQEDRQKEKSASKLKKAMLLQEGKVEGLKERIDVLRGSGVVLVDNTKVGAWNGLKGEFQIKVAAIDKLKLGFSGADVLAGWTVEMRPKQRDE